MSDVTDENTTKKRFYYPGPSVAWSAGTVGGKDVVDGTFEADYNTEGRFDLWAIPACDAYPDGLWGMVFNGAYYEAAEPGCNSWEKKLLCKIGFQSHKKETSYGTSAETYNNMVEYCHSEFSKLLDTTNLNPTPVELISIDDAEVSGTSGSYADLGIVFTGDVIADTTWSVVLAPTGVSLKGLTGEPDTVIEDGATKTITGTKEEINEEIANLQALVGTTAGSVTISWDYSQSATITVSVA